MCYTMPGSVLMLPAFTLYYINNVKHEKNVMTKFAQKYIRLSERRTLFSVDINYLTFIVIHCLRNMQTIKMNKYRQRIAQYLSLFLKVFISLFFISNVFHVTLSMIITCMMYHFSSFKKTKKTLSLSFSLIPALITDRKYC